MTEELTVLRRRVELPGGRELTVALYRDEGGGTAIVLRTGWPEDAGPLLRDGDGVMSLPGDVLPELVEALEELTSEQGAAR